MPFVASYFRRSAGAGQGTPIPPRRLDVTIYGADGTAPLRDRSNARYALEGLAFDSGLPGGFLSAGFTLRKPAAVSWPGREGLKVIIRRGSKILWWGWIEDISRSQHGRIEEIGVKCFGPWQEVGQRMCSPNYTGTMYGDAAIGQELRLHCGDISTDFSQLTATGVNLAPLTWSNKYISDLVKLVCNTGNDKQKPMLFAIWEPSYQAPSQANNALTLNGNVEAGSSSPDNWTFATISGSPTGNWTSEWYHSPARSLRVQGASGGTSEGEWKQSNVPCAASTAYTVDLWVALGFIAGTNFYAQFDWYTSGGSLISSSTCPTLSNTGNANWQRYVANVTSPGTAAKFNLRLRGTIPGSVILGQKYLDDIYVYRTGVAATIDSLPRARLWPRDLSGAEYLLYTGALDDGLAVQSTTRDLVNWVVASYGSGPSFTAAAEDAASQAAYRRREDVIEAGQSASATVAAAMRDAYLAAHKGPKREPGSIDLGRPGALRTLHGGRVWPEDLRAGDRVRIADGPEAGTVMLLTRVQYSDGEVSATPERADDASTMLAKAVG